MRNKIYFILFLVIVWMSSSRNVFARTLFEDNFDSGNLTKWTVARNDCLPNAWQVIGGKLSITINHPGGCSTEIMPNNANWDNSWNDYVLDFDMQFISGTDKNFAWRYTSATNWVDLHFFGSNVIFQRASLIDSTNFQLFSNGNTYHFKIIVKGNQFEVRYNNILFPGNVSILKGVDSTNSYPIGRPAFQASVGADPGSSVAFDNFIVSSINDLLNIPFWSQKDLGWGSQQYDTASRWYPSKPGIDRWGCALTSAAMVLKNYGYDKGPDGTEMNPGSLNTYLKTRGGYTKTGSLIWSYVTTFAAESQRNGNAPSTNSLLEFRYDNYDFNLLKSDLEAQHPDIIKIVMNDYGTTKWSDDALHFVVAKGVDGSDVYINDPASVSYTDTTVSGKYAGKTLRQLARFLPSHTDLSYIWLYQYNPDVNMLVEYDGKKTGVDGDGHEYNQIPGSQYFGDGSVIDADSADKLGGGMPTPVFLLPKPSTGKYLVTLSAKLNTTADVELHVFDILGNPTKFISNPTVYGGTTRFELNFAKTSADGEMKWVRKTSFDQVLALIDYLVGQKQITKPQIGNEWKNFILDVKTNYEIDHETGIKQLDIFLRSKLTQGNGKFITSPGLQLLQDEVTLLKSQL